MKTMALRVYRQQESALVVAQWLQSSPHVTSVLYAGLVTHPDYALHMTQASGGGAVVCFLTGDFEFSKHIVTATKLFKITVSFGGVTSLITVPGQMSHASIPADVRSAREFPEDLIRMSIGIESPQDLIRDLEMAMSSYNKKASGGGP
jgi:cystathionine beta-lyase